MKLAVRIVVVLDIVSQTVPAWRPCRVNRHRTLGAKIIWPAMLQIGNININIRLSSYSTKVTLRGSCAQEIKIVSPRAKDSIHISLYGTELRLSRFSLRYPFYLY